MQTIRVRIAVAVMLLFSSCQAHKREVPRYYWNHRVSDEWFEWDEAKLRGFVEADVPLPAESVVIEGEVSQ